MPAIRAIAGMPAFTHYAPLARTDPGATGVAIADIDGDGKPDFCLYGASHVAVLQNGGSTMNEIRLPGLEGGARGAAWVSSTHVARGDSRPSHHDRTTVETMESAMRAEKVPATPGPNKFEAESVPMAITPFMFSSGVA